MGIAVPSPNKLVLDCLRLLELRGVRAWRNNTGAASVEGRRVKFGAGKGGPDILGVLPAHSSGLAIHPPGRLLCCECKTGRGRLSADQRAWLLNASLAGACVLVARSVAELDDALRDLLGG